MKIKAKIKAQKQAPAGAITPRWDYREEREAIRHLKQLSDIGWEGSYWPIPETFRLHPPGFSSPRVVERILRKTEQLNSPWDVYGDRVEVHPLAAIIHLRTGVIVPPDELSSECGGCKLANISRDTAERLIMASDYNEKSTILLRITMLALLDSLALWAEFIKFPYNYECLERKAGAD